jgi:hypothetical protein
MAWLELKNKTFNKLKELSDYLENCNFVKWLLFISVSYLVAGSLFRLLV